MEKPADRPWGNREAIAEQVFPSDYPPLIISAQEPRTPPTETGPSAAIRLTLASKWSPSLAGGTRRPTRGAPHANGGGAARSAYRDHSFLKRWYSVSTTERSPFQRNIPVVVDNAGTSWARWQLTRIFERRTCAASDLPFPHGRSAGFSISQSGW